MKIVFFGTPEFAVPTLKKLISEKFEVVAVVTMPDRPAHRGQKNQPSPVKVVAEQNKIPVYYEIPTLDQLKKWGAEKIVVIAYGKMIPEEIYKNWHCLNVHPSKLPQYRGPSPLQSALLNGDSETAVTIMLIDKEMDAGDIVLQEAMNIDQNESFQSLHDRAAERGAELMVEALKLDLNKNSNKKSFPLFEKFYSKIKEETNEFIKGPDIKIDDNFINTNSEEKVA